MPTDRTPTVEMLWEACDPDETLSTRFGFRDAAAAATWVTATVEQHWAVRVVSCDHIVMSFHNVLAWLSTPDGPMLAKWSIAQDGFARLANAGDLVAWLDRQGLPVSAPIATNDGRHQVDVGGRSMSLQHTIDGELLDVDDPQQVYAAGVTLAALHAALAAFPQAERFGGARGWGRQPLRTQVSAWLDSASEQAPLAARRRLREMLERSPDQVLPTQLIHGDYRAANILCADREIVAILDFEDAGHGQRVADLARSAVLLGTRFRDWGPVSPLVREGFLDGYQSVTSLTDAEHAWWDPLVLWFSLTMIPSGDDPTGWADAALRQLG
ncbi:phosphotransferase [Flexivirga caeni]|uniref:Aminoglycoside phosphotransferase n=1 Tax=Flexivirga caeni TaxID=2294115 RepID=A0A3M9M873_9MICO|nr:phosphotransferase [Flexivirga caeni]RNI21397.1 aminoglycoside phosphotransferase [Flexivirga caeni]